VFIDTTIEALNRHNLFYLYHDAMKQKHHLTFHIEEMNQNKSFQISNSEAMNRGNERPQSSDYVAVAGDSVMTGGSLCRYFATFDSWQRQLLKRQHLTN
jgi:hypothetical protein